MRDYDFSKYEDRQSFYRSDEWRKIRLIKLAQDPLCEDCKKKGELTPAVAVDHIVDLKDSPWLCLVLSNLRSLCVSCHSRKTVQSQGWAKESLGKVLNNSWNIDVLKFRR